MGLVHLGVTASYIALLLYQNLLLFLSSYFCVHALLWVSLSMSLRTIKLKWNQRSNSCLSCLIDSTTPLSFPTAERGEREKKQENQDTCYLGITVLSTAPLTRILIRESRWVVSVKRMSWWLFTHPALVSCYLSSVVLLHWYLLSRKPCCGEEQQGKAGTPCLTWGILVVGCSWGWMGLGVGGN